MAAGRLGSVLIRSYLDQSVKRVFISSIQRDFDDVRQEVKAAVESMDLLPVMAEITPAAAGSSRDTILGQVRSSDVARSHRRKYIVRELWSSPRPPC